MDQLKITEREGANYKFYELDGALTAYTMGEFQPKLYSSVLKSNVVLDMEHLTDLDSSGIGLLMSAFNDSVEKGLKLYFLSMSPEADRALTETGFKSEFNLISSLTEAL